MMTTAKRTFLLALTFTICAVFVACNSTTSPTPSTQPATSQNGAASNESSPMPENSTAAAENSSASSNDSPSDMASAPPSADGNGFAGAMASPFTSSLTWLQTWWGGLTQPQRGDQIYAAGANDIGKDNDNCKVWCRTTVLNASQGLVTIPSTSSNDYSWVMPHKYVFPVANLRDAIHGDVLQMRACGRVNTARTACLSWTPHTAIVVSISGDQITVLDANWLSRKDSTGRGIGIVGKHTWSISGFLMNRTIGVSNFTLYRIGSGL